MEQAAEKRNTDVDLTTHHWLPKAMHELNSIAVNNGWEAHHYIKGKTHGGELRSTFVLDQWRVYIHWAYKGGILNANINTGPGTKQKMPKEFGLTQQAFTWVSDLLHDIGQPRALMEPQPWDDTIVYTYEAHLDKITPLRPCKASRHDDQGGK